MKKENNLQRFISRIEENILNGNQESFLLSNNSEKLFFGGKNRHCSNKDNNCDNSKNRSCSNYNQSGCKDSTNKGTCSNSKPS